MNGYTDHDKGNVMDDFLEVFAFLLIILSILWMHFRVTHVQVIVKLESRTNLSRIFLLNGIALLIVLLNEAASRRK